MAIERNAYKMKILIACKEFPHSRVIGGPVIVYNRLKYLSRNHTVSLAAFYRDEEKDFIPSVEDFCHDLELVPYPAKRSLPNVVSDFFTSPVPHYFLQTYNSPQMSEVIAGMVSKDRYDFVIAEYAMMGQFIHKNPLLPPVRRIMSVHECYYLARLKDFRHHGLGAKKLREAINLKGLKDYEFEMYREADKVLTLTPQGREELLEISPDLDIAIVPHGVDVEKFAYSEPEEPEKSIVFLGNYLHYPNADAVLYFYNEIWQKLKALVPDIKFYIVGQGPSPEIQNLGLNNDIVVTGKVDDVTPYLKKGRVFICPVRLGGGFRGKILEAMAVGRPVVSTSLGAEGIPAVNGENIIIADKEEGFAKGISDLLNDESLFQKISRNARQLVEEKYAWEKGVEILEGVLEEMMEKPPLK
jgi:glycosyltransferase involved in cell wall biosynthesis